ncbi:MAG: DUF4250 domain-containing protein [Verrucomicrobiota bacterium]
MEIENFRTMDPHLLVGIVNTALRNDYFDLEDLCKSHDIEEDALKARLKEGGYTYLSAQKRFA